MAHFDQDRHETYRAGKRGAKGGRRTVGISTHKHESGWKASTGDLALRGFLEVMDMLATDTAARRRSGPGHS